MPSRDKIIKDKMKQERNRRDKILEDRYERHINAYIKRAIFSLTE